MDNFYEIRLTAGTEVVITTLDALVALKGSRLLPHVQYLDIVEVFDDDKPPLVLQSITSGAYVQSLSIFIGLETSERAFRTALLSFIISTPNLRSFTCMVSTESATIFDEAIKYLFALSAALRSCTYLSKCSVEVTNCRIASPCLLPALASRPRLQELFFNRQLYGYADDDDEDDDTTIYSDTLEIPHNTTPDGNTDSAGTIACHRNGSKSARPRYIFPDLSKLSLHEANSDTIDILQSSRCPALRCLRLSFVYSYHLSDLRPIFRRMFTESTALSDIWVDSTYITRENF